MTADLTRDECDTKLTKLDFRSGLSERQQRFLDAYRKGPTIAPAARLARVHRATVYRWLADATFAAAMRAAADAFFQQHRAKVLAEQEAREQWRRQRELARRPMRCYYLARAREAKGQRRY
jgi:hypothetical protein